MRNSENITDRKKLKNYFKKGNLPGESAFEKLIDSTFNIADDKLDISEDGLMIYPSENGKDKLLSFFEDRDNTDATWVMLISKEGERGISINQIAHAKSDDSSMEESFNPPSLFIQKDSGKVGLGTNSPNQQLDVNGLISSKGRMGNFLEGYLPADGYWYNVFDTEEGLSGSNAFEIMAHAEGKEKEGRSALMHAIAVCSNGNSNPKITKTVAYQGRRWNKIDIRWESRNIRISKKLEEDKKEGFSFSGWFKSLFDWMKPKDPEKYNLQLRTQSNYGKDIKFHFKVTVLWNSEYINTGK